MNQPGLWETLRGIIWRDLLLAIRRRSDVAISVLFLVIVASLFPLGVGPEPAVLRTIAAGVLWVAALLACLLSLGRVFTGDYLDGVLEQMLLIAQPLPVLVAGKVFAHWVVSGLPVVLLSPLLGLQFGLEGEALGMLVLSLLLGTPTLSMIGSIGAALVLGVRGSGLLVALLVLPLYVPVLIFGAGAVTSSMAGIGGEANLSLLGACLVLSSFFAPWATASALRIALE
ncbi:heme exporter protein CcmB [Candidatus Nitrospira inopinata]|jgi:heme exporter protein B|uniref:Heme exporter protein B n=1 Tax=Candidatus Nitrospira inopinata TaxID=1715989 RepID=A0A0S4KPG7_9BACT|nr:heme exporter protein CcmB [Candidatus Nitrospira inopinata]CUQ65050.1 Heme exporter protein CcmB [Candidatus Nitrospira inopinata]